MIVYQTSHLSLKEIFTAMFVVPFLCVFLYSSFVPHLLPFSYSTDDELLPSQLSHAPITPPPPSPEPLLIPSPPRSPAPLTPTISAPSPTIQTPIYRPQPVTMTSAMKPPTPTGDTGVKKRPLFGPELDLMDDVNRFSIPKLKSVKRPHSIERPTPRQRRREDHEPQPERIRCLQSACVLCESACVLCESACVLLKNGTE